MVLAEAIEALDALLGQPVQVFWGPVSATDTGLAMAGGMRGNLRRVQLESSPGEESSVVKEGLSGQRAYFYGCEAGGEVLAWFRVDAARLQTAEQEEDRTRLLLNFGTYALQVGLSEPEG
jgi:hypothetical protein